jgi:TPR repeat protein
MKAHRPTIMGTRHMVAACQSESGHGHGQLMLGRYLASATGKPNPVEGRQWLERAVGQGILDAESDLAELNRRWQ